MKLIFMGTPEFAKIILAALLEHYEVILVVTKADSHFDRSKNVVFSPIKKLALEKKIPIFQPLKIKEEFRYITDLKPDLVITAAYGQIIPKKMLDLVPCINVHGSLLPKYRGGAPIQYSLFNNDQKTGVTLMEMSLKMDAGNIIDTASIDIDVSDNYESLSQKLAHLGSKLLLKNIDAILAGSYFVTPQNENLVTYAYNIKPTDEILYFNESAISLFGKIRGLSPKPGAYFIFNHKKFKILKAWAESNTLNLNQGEICITNSAMMIGCKVGVLNVLEIQPEGKKCQAIKPFLNGQKYFINGQNLLN